MIFILLVAIVVLVLLMTGNSTPTFRDDGEYYDDGEGEDN